MKAIISTILLIALTGCATTPEVVTGTITKKIDLGDGLYAYIIEEN